MKKLVLLCAVFAMSFSTALIAQDADKKCCEKKKTECAEKKDADKKCCKETKAECTEKKDADKKCCKEANKETADAKKSCGKK